jgi:hypothetical protein
MSTTAAAAAKRPVLRTPSQLRADLATYVDRLSDARRLQGTTKAALSNHMLSGDEEAVNASRQELSQLAHRIQDLDETIEALRNAIERSEAAAIRERKGKAYAAIARRFTATRDVIGAHADALSVCGRGYVQSLDGFEAVVRVCIENGVPPPDPFSLQAKFSALCEQAIYVASDGRLGQPRGLDSIDQIRRAPGLADQAAEWCEVHLRRVRAALGIADERGED